MPFNNFVIVACIILSLEIKDSCCGAPQVTPINKEACKRPDPVENAQLKPKYDGINEFDHEDIVEYGCMAGYTTGGRGRKRRCINGEWTEVKFNCTLIFCPELPGIQNGKISQDMTDDIRNSYESVVEYTCNSGYFLKDSGKYTRKCQADGTWTGQEPSCYKACQQPEPVKNAELKPEYGSINEFKHDDFVEYTCIAGYELLGRNQKRHCNSGKWSKAKFICRPIRCQELPPIPNGRISQDTTDGIRNNYGSVTEYTCNSGYFLKDNDNRYTRTCQADGSWSGQEPSCYKACGRPEAVENAELNLKYDGINEFKHDDVVEYACKIGYLIEGRSRRRFCSNGKWSDVRFTCKLIRCSYLGPPEHGQRLDVNNGAGEFTRFGCDVGYKMRGTQSLLCRTDGEWSPRNPPTCDPILCPELPRIRNGRIFQDTTDGIRNDYESVTEYTCNSGYLLNGHKKSYTRECQADGTWSGEEPFCDVPRCAQIEPFYGGDVIYLGDRKRWSQAFYNCDDGYSLFPDFDNSECTRELTWNPSPPQCLRMAEVGKPKNGFVRGKEDILHHTEYYNVYCNSGYELYSDTFLNRKTVRIRNNNGTLEPNVPTCVEARCDPADLYKAVVKYENGSQTRSKILSQTLLHLSCQQGFDYYKNDKPMDKPVVRNCVRGSIKKAPHCEEARCLFSGYPNNHVTYHRYDEGIFLVNGQYLYPRDKIEVVCRDDYELFVNSTETYLPRFTSECRFGKFQDSFNNFPICLENRCLFKPSQHVCLSTGINGKCRKGEFKVQSGSSVALNCIHGYKLHRFEDGSSTEAVNQTSVLCSKGTYFQDFKCIPDSFLQKIKHYAERIEETIATTIDRFTCRFSIFGGVDYCKDSCLIPEIPSGFAKSLTVREKISGEAKHGMKITVQCEPGYDLSKHIITTCKFGDWDIDEFPHCSPKPCQLFLKTGIMFWVNSKLLSEDDGATQTFLNGTKLDVECAKGFEMEDMVFKRKVKSIRRDSVCILGSWTNKYSCSPAHCPVPVVHHATLLTKASQTYEHMDKITFKCDDGHHFGKSNEPSVKVDAICFFGNWNTNIPASCQPDSCMLTIEEGSKYYISNRSVEITVGKWIEDGTSVHLECVDGFDLFDNNGRFVNETNSSPIVKCHQGHWKNAHHCRKQCTTINLIDFRLIGENDTNGNNVTHGEKVKCEFDAEKFIKCHNGKWQGLEECIDKRNKTTVVGFTSRATQTIPTTATTATEATTTTIITTTTTTSTATTFPTTTGTDAEQTAAAKDESSFQQESNDSEDYMIKSEEEEFEQSEEYSVEPESENINDENDKVPNENGQSNEGCVLPADERYNFFDEFAKQIEHGSMVRDGTTLTVMCSSADYFYYNYLDYNGEETTITCRGNVLSQIEAVCPELVPDTCLELENGNVAKEYGQFDVSCNEGFSLDLIVPENSLCDCEDGILKSVVSGQIPYCKPDNCIIPDVIRDHLSVADMDDAILSAGFSVKHRHFAYFNCLKVDEKRYEPVNRRFRCEFGKWIEAEKDPNWKLGNYSNFPACREARCEPQCENGGICNRDDNCECKHLTLGEHCETVLCENECTLNGGTCKDGYCACPQGRFGSNCEIIGCKLPADSATPKQKKTNNFYEPGDKLTDFECENNDILSSKNGMICQENGSWSDIVKCVRAVVYLISVKTVDRSGYITGEGTNANVHIYLHGQTEHTEKINLRGRFEAGDLDETRVKAKDVRPIVSVVVGHDNSGFYPDWHLEFASIYIENVNEYYIFRPRRPVWIKEYDVLIPNIESCIHYFDKGHGWFPKWNKIKRYQQFHFGKGDRMSWRACQQDCVELWPEKCQSVYYNKQRRVCWGFSISSDSYFVPGFGDRHATVYLRSCQKF